MAHNIKMFKELEIVMIAARFLGQLLGWGSLLGYGFLGRGDPGASLGFLE
jgi:hypothetical protein